MPSPLTCHLVRLRARDGARRLRRFAVGTAIVACNSPTLWTSRRRSGLKPALQTAPITSGCTGWKPALQPGGIPWFSGLICCLVSLSLAVRAQTPDLLPGTQLLTWDGDLSARMVAGIDKFLSNQIEHSVGERAKLWNRNFSSRDAYEKSIRPNRERFRKYIGAVDPR